MSSKGARASLVAKPPMVHRLWTNRRRGAGRTLASEAEAQLLIFLSLLPFSLFTRASKDYPTSQPVPPATNKREEERERKDQERKRGIRHNSTAAQSVTNWAPNGRVATKWTLIQTPAQLILMQIPSLRLRLWAFVMLDALQNYSLFLKYFSFLIKKLWVISVNFNCSFGCTRVLSVYGFGASSPCSIPVSGGLVVRKNGIYSQLRTLIWVSAPSLDSCAGLTDQKKNNMNFNPLMIKLDPALLIL